MPSRRVMSVQARAKNVVKPLLFADESALRRIRHGPAKGIAFNLNRRTDLQREFGLYESELNGFYRRCIRANSIVYDVGAGDGLTALMFTALAPMGHVYAFEYSDVPAAKFERNLVANPQLATRVTLVRDAVSPADVRLDEFARREPAPDFVKIDVDGAEVEVLETMGGVLANRSLRLVVETHSPELENECLRILRGAGHEMRVVRPAWWRVLYPEFRPIEHNRWLVSAAA